MQCVTCLTVFLPKNLQNKFIIAYFTAVNMHLMNEFVNFITFKLVWQLQRTTNKGNIQKIQLDETLIFHSYLLMDWIGNWIMFTDCHDRKLEQLCNFHCLNVTK